MGCIDVCLKKWREDSGADAVYVSSGCKELKVWRRWNAYLLVGCSGWVVFLGSVCVEICWKWAHWGSWVCGYLGQDLDDKGAPMKQIGLLPMVNIMQIAWAKSLSERGASHQPTFMNSCLAISYTCFSCLPRR